VNVADSSMRLLYWCGFS